MGALEGAPEGASLGTIDGFSDGASEGASEGNVVGGTEGACEGDTLGKADGALPQVPPAQFCVTQSRQTEHCLFSAQGGQSSPPQSSSDSSASLIPFVQCGCVGAILGTSLGALLGA